MLTLLITLLYKSVIKRGSFLSSFLINFDNRGADRMNNSVHIISVIRVFIDSGQAGASVPFLPSPSLTFFHVTRIHEDRTPSRFAATRDEA